MAEKLITASDLKKGTAGISEKRMISDFEVFLKDVEAGDFAIVPTLSTFADAIGRPRADIHEWFRLHPTASKQMRDMCADTIAMGAMLKKYVPNVTNFALKNWCGWEEAPKKTGNKSKEKADEKKAREALDAYIAAERRKSFKVV